MSISPFLLASRPKTLPAALVPVAAGCIVAWRMTGHWSPVLALWTVLSALFIQIATNLFNDAIDHDKNADTAKRTGPLRVTASGLLSPKAVYAAAFTCLALAVLFSLPLVQLRGWPIVAIGIPSLYFTYGYTGGPMPLAYKGLGEVFVFIFFGLAAVLGTVYVQTGFPPGEWAVIQAAIPAAFQCGLLSCVIIEINNIRDREEDRTTGKNTLAVRLGDARARRLAIAFLLGSYVLIPSLMRAMLLPLNWLWIPSAFMALALALRIRRTPAGPGMNGLLAFASLHLVFFFVTLWVVCRLESA